MEFLENIDRELFLFLNSLHADWLDPVMKFISSSWFWIPFVALFIFLSIKYFRKKFWIPLVLAIVCYALTDQITNIVKQNVERVRPTHNTEICDKVHTVDGYKGGQYSFFSGHAANSFGLALLSLLFIRKKYYTVIVMVWASLVTYSRLYLGVHYPADLFAGALFGSVIAFLIFKLHKFIPCFRLQSDCFN